MTILFLGHNLPDRTHSLMNDYSLPRSQPAGQKRKSILHQLGVCSRPSSLSDNLGTNVPRFPLPQTCPGFLFLIALIAVPRFPLTHCSHRCTPVSSPSLLLSLYPGFFFPLALPFQSLLYRLSSIFPANTQS